MKNTIVILGLILFIWIPGKIQAQSKISSDQSSSKMSVKGTSTLHDWESTVEKFNGSAIIDGNALKNVRFVAKVKSIKSGKSGMDKNTYNALKSGQHPEITFQADELKINGSNVTGNGKLTIAGSSKTIPVKLSIETWNNNTYLILGNIDLKMTDYGIDPPRAVMGTIRTGDDITISFELNMKPD